MKKKIARSIYSAYRAKMQDSFKKWKQYVFEQELNSLRNLALKNSIVNRNKKLLRNAIQQFKRNCRLEQMREEIKCKIMQRWKKTLILKVFKINRKQRQKDRNVSSKTTSRAKSRYDS